MKKQKNIYIIIALLVFILTGCTNALGQNKLTSNNTINNTSSNSSKTSNKKLKILVTNPLIKDLITSIAGTYHEVDVLVTEADKMDIYKPDLYSIVEKDYNCILYIGSGYEPFMKDLLDKVDKNKLDVINLSRGIDVHRFKQDKIEFEDYYFLTNSQNYQIALFSIKNVLEEVDRDRANYYENNFIKQSKEIDVFKSDIKEFNIKYPNYKFVCENDHTTYIADEYGKDNIKIQDYKIEIANSTNTNNTNSKSSNTTKEKVLFLYSNDSALKKYADDISKYKMKPVKIKLYDYSMSFTDIYKENFEKIKKGVES